MSRRERSSSWSSTSRIGPVRRCSVLLRGSLVCAWCRLDPTPPDLLPGRRLEVDHVRPREEGGPLHPWNLVPACCSCNEARRDPDGLEARLRVLGLSVASALAEVARQTCLPLDVRAGKDLARLWYPWLDRYRAEHLVRQRAEALRRRAARAAASLDDVPF